MASLRERNRTRTRLEIENAALELFERQGYDRTSVEEIADQAGISRATFFRYYPSKEELLFTNESEAVDEMVKHVAQREDSDRTLLSLASPFARFGHHLLDDDSSEGQRLTRLVMTTRELEARSMRMRLRWERALARQLAHERGSEAPDASDVLLANLAVGCLAAALWEWQAVPEPISIDRIIMSMFAQAQSMIAAD
ncbi:MULTISPECIES: TetR family transcriptional regulator [Rhodococcus]|uniref:TetR family transcriptional regulator n=1 Tax=Rhodococcus oxybenzonivorans TaxID=1990687 RepID=A0AAE4UZ46_9NOCA|nr:MULTISPECIES: TetR family transcriptional regulator [Rhodococcus]MDV7241881.1 TetR family transcriptional regulator [Rhodococcus oxybenzonivorans]MDV7265465.1 TetR family transcriptional regulator [Rhodococcus oxybenzonivorans]MDV7273585.1 TetR family transcriptional regulator [Rhodococcus oxybenzonivorans]MDV7334163.1 TetR family transcriptional regulator [Rhodococcus oxybenzonivorans]MDV7343582.1 TetR family transcriptional regulator [Rhodococcus oxybenzonivorans]